ncbi:NF-kappa-B inhibitor-like protein 1 [Struthio camelus]|uniref:NF-kappa-B inhibitor-like protein 1 n=1 Tax=Struthio camelus TaxID=8801 RepID=UPI003603CE2A
MGSHRRRHRGDQEPPAPPRCRCPEPEVPGGRTRRGVGGWGSPTAAPRLPHGCSGRPQAAPEPPSPDGGWRQRLLQEWEDECGEPQCYREDFAAPEPEPYDAWADRIAEEHRRKRSRQGSLDAARGPPKPPPGPSHRRREAESRLYWQRQREKEEQVRRARAQRTGGARTAPETSCREPPEAREPPEPGALLRYDDIPWPCAGGGPEAMAAAALEAAPAPPAGPPGPYRRLLRQQRARWHPDRFAQRWGARLHPRDRQRVLAAVTALSQALNRRADAAK